MTDPKRIGDLIEAPPVRTVMRLADAEAAPEPTCASFVFTADVDNHIHALAASLARPEGKGFFVRGDFGCGKSHLLAALSAWFDRGPGADRLSEHHPGLARLDAQGKRFLPVSVSLVDFRATTLLESILVLAIEQKFHSRGVDVPLSPLARYLDEFRQMLRDPALAAAFGQRVGRPVAQLGD